MDTILPLRGLAIASNILFIVYGLAAQLYPVLLLHAVLLPINIGKIFQLVRKNRFSIGAATCCARPARPGPSIASLFVGPLSSPYGSPAFELATREPGPAAQSGTAVEIVAAGISFDRTQDPRLSQAGLVKLSLSEGVARRRRQLRTAIHGCLGNTGLLHCRGGSARPRYSQAEGFARPVYGLLALVILGGGLGSVSGPDSSTDGCGVRDLVWGWHSADLHRWSVILSAMLTTIQVLCIGLVVVGAIGLSLSTNPA